jgi:hypothetical protein
LVPPADGRGYTEIYTADNVKVAREIYTADNVKVARQLTATPVEPPSLRG